jgi:hypothetical protein
LRQARGLRAKPGQWGVGQADAELVDAVERSMQRGQGVEGKGSEAGPGQRRRGQGRKLRSDTRMSNCDQ